MLLTDRRRGFGMHDEDSERGALQGSLFAPESPAPPRPPGLTPDPFAPAPAPDIAAAPDYAVPVADDGLDAPSELVVPVDLEAPTAPRSGEAAPRRRAAALSGPTLDDVMSRVWEGMRAEVPTPCPVCRTEVEPSMGGRCGSCGSALD
jgi:hypothetical protein